MRLLIVTQALDTGDPVLGFFHRWVELFAKECTEVVVVCLREGTHQLPRHVRVHSLGKERGWGRLRRTARFLSLLWRERHTYDAVFVHMNEEYILLGGLLWRLLGKRAAMWRNHRLGSWRTRLAVRFARVVFYTSPEAYVAYAKKAVRMPVGIELGAPLSAQPDKSILSLGRLDPIKKLDLVLEALQLLPQEVILHIYGEPTPGNEEYAAALRSRYKALEAAGRAVYHGGVPHEEAVRLFSRHKVFVNATPAGSFDKTLLEAAAAGALLVAVNPALRGVLPQEFLAEPSAPSLARALGAALALPEDKTARERARLRAYVEAEHTLHALVQKALSCLVSAE